MIGKDLQMEHTLYPIFVNRVCLLSNYLPDTELKEDENNINAHLFLNNLKLKRKQKRDEVFLNNNVSKVNLLTNDPEINVSQTDNMDKSNDPDKSDFQSEQIDSPSTSKNLDNCDRDSEEWEELSHKELRSNRKVSPQSKLHQNETHLRPNAKGPKKPQ